MGRQLAFEPGFPDTQLFRRGRLALDETIVAELDHPDSDVQFPFLATAPDLEPNVLTQLLVEETEDGSSALTFQSLAVDADNEVVLLQTVRSCIETGRRASDPAHGIQVHAEEGDLSCGAFDRIAGVTENRLVGRHVGAGDVPAEEGFVRLPADAVDDAIRSSVLNPRPRW